MYKCVHVCTCDQVNDCGGLALPERLTALTIINGGLTLPESSPVLPIIGGTSVCLPLTLLKFGAVTGTPTILVITPLHDQAKPQVQRHDDQPLVKPYFDL